MQAEILIKIYDYICIRYKVQLRWEVQRFGNNQYQRGTITDEELITIYLFCVAFEEKYKIKSMHKFIKRYWSSWFPCLPSYQAFDTRLNRLCDAFALLLSDFLSTFSIPENKLRVALGDSFPVVTCSHKRNGKVANDITDKGYCPTKKLHFYGVKVHAIGYSRSGTIPFPQHFDITEASVHDLTALRFTLEALEADVSVLDKAYADAFLESTMQTNNSNMLLTPIKEKTGWEKVLRQFDKAYNDVYNKAASTIRQPIESLFNWINELTTIQNASKVRSSKGLKLHIFGKLAAALMILSIFNS